ncbi:hypothetical protein XaraCFBP7407_22190 [Xanthomonas arboricola pv. arracaciae]|uniref:XopAH/AvrB family type III secretion system effector n=1 Tax=Xanthomonas arboricola TaxID=56448 RepID=UPI000CEE1C6C|nr:XopAH/AvrB family type III secretion system effector [Xanthomonas arboricola]PPT90972.1 hypothetical protein XaraCFBP7407_22190 [Xanthomonas arboricola pv. arracaciae]
MWNNQNWMYNIDAYNQARAAQQEDTSNSPRYSEVTEFTEDHATSYGQAGSLSPELAALSLQPSPPRAANSSRTSRSRPGSLFGRTSGSREFRSSSETPNRLPGPSTSLDWEEQSLVGAARWPSMYNQSHTDENKDYCRSMYRSSREAGSRIASGQINSFSELWNCATEWRLGRLSYNAPGREAFATQREAGSVFNTKLDMQYASIIPMIINNSKSKRKRYAGPYLSGIECKVYKQKGKIHGQEIPLNELWAAIDQRQVAVKLQEVYNQDVDFEVLEDTLQRNHPNNIVHTDARYLSVIKGHLEQLFNQAKSPLRKREALDLIARIHWWAASAAPDMRGSAAKAEFAARALANAHGIEFPPFRDGIVPDIEAMLSSEKNFVERYSSFMERRPS